MKIRNTETTRIRTFSIDDKRYHKIIQLAWIFDQALNETH